MEYISYFASVFAYAALAAICLGCLKSLWGQGIALSNAGFFKSRAAFALAAILGVLAQLTLVQMVSSNFAEYDWTMNLFGVFIFGYSLLVQLGIAKVRFAMALSAATSRGWEEEVKLYNSLNP